MPATMTKPHSFSDIKSSSQPGYFSSPLGAAEKKFYDDNGYLVLDRVLSEAEVKEITDDALRICRNEDGAVQGVDPAPPGLSDEEIMKRVLCIHFPHKITQIMRATLSHPAIVQALTTMIGPDVKCMQSMMFYKAAGKPGQAWHQDEDYIPTRDRSLIGAWISLDDATVENGCLWIIPGSHRPGVLWKQEWHSNREFDCAMEARGFPYTAADEVPVEVKKGSVVFFNGYTLHRSLANRATSGFRRALVNHYMSASSLLPWRVQEKNSIALTDFRDIVMVAGTDPYAYKGTEDIAKTFVRSDGGTGCVDWITKEPLAYADQQ